MLNEFVVCVCGCVRESERNISKINGAILVIKYSCAGEVFRAYLKSVGE